MDIKTNTRMKAEITGRPDCSTVLRVAMPDGKVEEFPFEAFAASLAAIHPERLSAAMAIILFAQIERTQPEVTGQIHESETL